jgi:hypothetical protein
METTVEVLTPQTRKTLVQSLPKNEGQAPDFRRGDENVNLNPSISSDSQLNDIHETF